MGKVLLVPESQQGAHFPEFGFVFEACYFICFTARWWREYYFSIDLFGSGNEPMDHIEAVLKRIKNGETRFEPLDDSQEALNEFQSTVQTLREAKKQDLVVSLILPPVSKGRNSYGLTTVALVNGGVTYRGEQYLASPPRKMSETRTWVMNHLAQFSVTVIGAVLAAVIISRWGLQ